MSEENKNEIISRKENNHEYNSYQVNYMMNNQMRECLNTMKEFSLGMMQYNQYNIDHNSTNNLIEILTNSFIDLINVTNNKTNQNKSSNYNQIEDVIDTFSLLEGQVLTKEKIDKIRKIFLKGEGCENE